MDLYIYYRVQREQAPALQQQVLAMQRQLAAQAGVVTGLKRRPEEKDGRQTWMEIYASVPSGFAALLERAVTEANLAARIEGERHTEQFQDIPSCA